MRHLVFACFLLLALAVGGCNQSIIIDTPSSRVTGVKLIEQTDEGSRVNVIVELSNPNDIPLPLIQSDYDVKIGNAETFTFTDRLARTLPASGKQVVELPAVFRGNNAGANYHVSGSVTYKPPGEIRKLLYDSGLPMPSSGFSSSGKLE